MKKLSGIINCADIYDRSKITSRCAEAYRDVFVMKGGERVSDIGSTGTDELIMDEAVTDGIVRDEGGQNGKNAETGGVPQEKLYTRQELDAELKKQSDDYRKKLDELKRLSEMSEEQRAEYRRDEFDRSLTERENAVARRELAADAAESLERAGLPKILSACLNYGSREECENSLAAVRKAFGEAVSYAVTERMRGRVPRSPAGEKNDAFLDGLGM